MDVRCGMESNIRAWMTVYNGTSAFHVSKKASSWGHQHIACEMTYHPLPQGAFGRQWSNTPYSAQELAIASPENIKSPCLHLEVGGLFARQKME